MSDPPKKRKSGKNAAGKVLEASGPTGNKNDVRYFEERYETCMKEADVCREEGNRSGERAWKARALETALYLSVTTMILDGEKASLWRDRVTKLTGSVHKIKSERL